MNDENDFGGLIDNISPWVITGQDSSIDAKRLASVAKVLLQSLNQQTQKAIEVKVEAPKLQVRLNVQEALTLQSFEDFKESAFFDEKHKEFPVTLKELILIAREQSDLTSLKFFVARCLDCNCIRDDFSLEDLGEFNQIFKGISFKVIEKLLLVKYKDLNKISLCDLPVLREVVTPDMVNVSKFSGLLKAVDANANKGKYHCQNAVIYDFDFNRATSLKLKTKDGKIAFMDFEKVGKIKEFVFESFLKNMDTLKQLKIVKFSKLDNGKYLIEVGKDFEVERLNTLIDNIIEAFSDWTAINVNDGEWYSKSFKDITPDVKKDWLEITSAVITKFFIDEVFSKNNESDTGANIVNAEESCIDVVSYRI